MLQSSHENLEHLPGEGIKSLIGEVYGYEPETG
jgi:hypothetical protein